MTHLILTPTVCSVVSGCLERPSSVTLAEVSIIGSKDKTVSQADVCFQQSLGNERILWITSPLQWSEERRPSVGLEIHRVYKIVAWSKKCQEIVEMTEVVCWKSTQSTVLDPRIYTMKSNENQQTLHWRLFYYQNNRHSWFSFLSINWSANQLVVLAWGWFLMSHSTSLIQLV